MDCIRAGISTSIVKLCALFILYYFLEVHLAVADISAVQQRQTFKIESDKRKINFHRSVLFWSKNNIKKSEVKDVFYTQPLLFARS